MPARSSPPHPPKAFPASLGADPHSTPVQQAWPLQPTLIVLSGSSLGWGRGKPTNDEKPSGPACQNAGGRSLGKALPDPLALRWKCVCRTRPFEHGVLGGERNFTKDSRGHSMPKLSLVPATPSYRGISPRTSAGARWAPGPSH